MIDSDCTNKQSYYFLYTTTNYRLFLEETKPKIFTTALKDHKFLNFFFRQLRNNDVSKYNEYPFISPCGNEMNFVKCHSTTPIVFHDLKNTQIENDNENSFDSSSNINSDINTKIDNSSWNLIFGGNLKVPLQPESLCVNSYNGRVYHPIAENSKCKNLIQEKSEYGLIGSHLLLRLSNAEIITDSQEEGRIYDFCWQGTRHNLPVFEYKIEETPE